jgi:Mg/Co/Ni transporter MgtE
MENAAAREAIRRVLIYPVTTVGALTDPSAVFLRTDMPLSEAIAALREDRRGAERAVWLVNDSGAFTGQLDLQQALVAHSDRQPLGDWCIALRPLRAESTLTAARDVPEWLKYAELPVVDHQDHLLGTVSRERLMHALGSMEVGGPGLVEDVGDLVRQYFHVMGTVLGDLFSLSGRNR